MFLKDIVIAVTAYWIWSSAEIEKVVIGAGVVT